MAKKKKPDVIIPMSPYGAALLNKDADDDTGGRPEAPINWDRVEAAMMVGGSLLECASMGGVHYNTLERRILKRYGENFRVVREAFMTDRKMMARKQLFSLVAKGNVRATLFVNRAINKINDRLREDEEDDKEESPSFRLAYNLDEPPPIDAEFTKKEDET